MRFKAAGQRIKLHLWTILGLKFPRVPAPLAIAPGGESHFDPAIVDERATAAFVQSRYALNKSFLQKLIDDVHVSDIPALFNVRQLRARTERLMYGGQQLAAIVRQMQNTHLVTILDQPYKSYLEHGRAMINHVAVRATRDHLRDGYVVAMPGDWPSQAFARTLLDQGRRELGRGRCPQKLGHLLRHCDPLVFDKIRVDLGLQGDDTGVAKAEVIIAEAALNMHPWLGPLHQKINQVKDLSEWWWSLLNKIWKRMAGKDLPKIVPLPQSTPLLESLLNAWVGLREPVLAFLDQPENVDLRKRFDVSSLLYLLETSLPIALLNYSVYFKTGNGDGYLDGMCYEQVLHIARSRHNYDGAVLTKVSPPWSCHPRTCHCAQAVVHRTPYADLGVAVPQTGQPPAASAAARVLPRRGRVVRGGRHQRDPHQMCP